MVSRPMTKPLTVGEKLAFGAGDLGTAITANILVFFLLIFFTNVAGMNAGLAGSVLMIGKIWDAINDPIIGVLSDRTKNARWGRRHSWMFWGAIPFGLTFFLQWIIPTDNQWILFAYYVLVGILFNTCYTAVNLPYTAMTPEMTQDYNERTSLNSFRFTFSIGGSIGSLLLAQVIFQQVKDPVNQYLIIGLVTAIISVLPLYWCIFGTRNRIKAAEAIHLAAPVQAQIPYRQQLKLVFSNRPFVYVMGIYLCSWLAVQITASMIAFFVIDWMKLPAAAATQVALAVQGTALVMLFVWSWFSKRYGKKAVYFFGMVIWMIAQAGLFFLQPHQVGLMYGMAILAGVGVSTAYLIPWSMIPDVVDLDELNTGQRREGIFYGFMVLLQKMGLAFGLFIVGQGLNFAGFISSGPGDTPPIQPDSALLAIRLAIGPVPTVFLALGIVLAYLYPITQEYHTQILLQLQSRHQANGEEG